MSPSYSKTASTGYSSKSFAKIIQTPLKPLPNELGLYGQSLLGNTQCRHAITGELLPFRMGSLEHLTGGEDNNGTFRVVDSSGASGETMVYIFSSFSEFYALIDLTRQDATERTEDGYVDHAASRRRVINYYADRWQRKKSAAAANGIPFTGGGVMNAFNGFNWNRKMMFARISAAKNEEYRRMNANQNKAY